MAAAALLPLPFASPSPLGKVPPTVESLARDSRSNAPGGALGGDARTAPSPRSTEILSLVGTDSAFCSCLGGALLLLLVEASSSSVPPHCEETLHEPPPPSRSPNAAYAQRAPTRPGPHRQRPTATPPVTWRSQLAPVCAPPHSLLVLQYAPPEMPARTEKLANEQRAPSHPRPHTQRDRTQVLPSPPHGRVALHAAPPERSFEKAA